MLTGDVTFYVLYIKAIECLQLTCNFRSNVSWPPAVATIYLRVTFGAAISSRVIVVTGGMTGGSEKLNDGCKHGISRRLGRWNMAMRTATFNKTAALFLRHDSNYREHCNAFAAWRRCWERNIILANNYIVFIVTKSLSLPEMNKDFFHYSFRTDAKLCDVVRLVIRVNDDRTAKSRLCRRRFGNRRWFTRSCLWHLRNHRSGEATSWKLLLSMQNCLVSCFPVR